MFIARAVATHQLTQQTPEGNLFVRHGAGTLPRTAPMGPSQRASRTFPPDPPEGMMTERRTIHPRA